MPLAPPVPPGIELSKSQRKSLASLGHHIVRLAAACERLRARAEEFPALQPWLPSSPATTTPASAPARPRESLLIGPGAFACPLTLDQGILWLHPLVATGGLPESLEAGGRVPPPAEISPLLAAPLWPALLRLRPLRDFWERELRRATLEALIELVPDAWILDPSPLPPGAVIPRLEISSWEAFDPAADATRNFLRTDDRILTAIPKFSAAAQEILSCYQNDGQRVDWIGAVGRQPSAGLQT